MIQEVAVADLAEQVRGVSYDKAEALSSPRAGYLPVLRAGNITDHGLLFDDMVFVPRERIADKQRIRRNDVVIATSSGSVEVVGKAAQAAEDFDGGFGAFCKLLRPRPCVDPRYFGHFFRTPAYRRRASSLAAGANINNLRNEHLDEMRIPFPPLPEQRRIAEILDKADALRAKRRAALAQLDALTQSVFLDMFGDPSTNPKGWASRKVGDLLESASYGTSAKAGAVGEFPVLRMNNITRTGDLDLTDLKFMDLAENERERYLVRDGDVLFNRTNSPELVGKSAIFRGSHPMAYAGYLIRLRVNNGTEPDYLAAFLNSAYAKRVLRGMCKSIIGMANINATELQSIGIMAPPLRLQQQFARAVREIERLKTTQRTSLTAVNGLFDALQHRAFRGDL